MKNEREFYSIHLLDLDTGEKSVVEKNRFAKIRRKNFFNEGNQGFDPEKFLRSCEQDGCWLSADMYLNVDLFDTGAVFKFYKVDGDDDILILTGGCGRKEEHKKEVWPLLTAPFGGVEVAAPDVPYIVWHREPSDKVTDEEYQRARALNYLLASLYLRA